jgi:crotonobetainyl-CoA hydratase
MDTALALAAEIRAGAPLAIAAVQEILAATGGLDVREGFARLRSGDLTAYARMQGSEDAVEGPRAFSEKRPPRWRGR